MTGTLSRALALDGLRFKRTVLTAGARAGPGAVGPCAAAKWRKASGRIEYLAPEYSVQIL